MRVLSLLFLLASLMACSCSTLPTPEPTQERQAVQPQLFAYETAEGLRMNWGWFTWGEETIEGATQVVPQQFKILVSVGERGNWQEIALVAGTETTFSIPDPVAGQAYFLAVQATAEQAAPTRSNVVMVVPGGGAVLAPLMPEDGKDRREASWGPNDQWITYTRLIENKRQLYRFRLESRSEIFMMDGYAPSSAREIDRTVFLLEEQPPESDLPEGPALVSTSENGLSLLLEAKGQMTSPALSPSGNQVLFVAEREESWGLWQFDIQENELQRLLGSVNLPIQNLAPQYQTAHHPAWAPDGEIIAYDRFTDKGGWVVRDVYSISTFGGAEELLLRSEWNDFAPAWHPDGKQIAFLSDRSGRLAIWSYQPETGELRQWTGGLDLKIDPETRLEWNQAGSLLLFTAVEEDDRRRLMLARP